MTDTADIDRALAAHEQRMVRDFGPDWHCDDWWSKRLGPPCVHAFLDWARAPAHGADREHKPPLYATYKGQRVRVLMASRFGDVGIAKISRGKPRRMQYEERVVLGQLEKFSDKP